MNLNNRPYLGDAIPNKVQGFSDWVNTATSAAEAFKTAPNQIAKSYAGKLVSIATAAIPIPVAGWIIAGAAAILTVLGITVRGRTEHVNQTVAERAGLEYGISIGNIYAALPADAKAQMLSLMITWERTMYDGFAGWWGALIARQRLAALTQFPNVPLTAIARSTGAFEESDWRTWLQTFYANNLQAWIRDTIGYYYATVMHQVDADSVNDTMKTYFFDRIGNMVLQPLDAYMVEKYNATVEQYLAAGGKGLKPISAAIAGIGPIIGFGILGAVIFAATKKKRRTA